MSSREPERAGLRRLDRLTSLLARLATRQPLLASMVASASGALRNRMTGRWPTVNEVAALFPHLPAYSLARIAAAIGAHEERTAVFVRCLRQSGIGPARPLAAIAGTFREVDGPCILGTFHVGAFQTLGIALEALGKPVLAFRDGTLHESPAPVELQSSRGSDQQRAAGFIRAVDHLRRGGLVLMALDGERNASIRTECLGRPLMLARGPFALARITGAPIVPLAIRWARKGTRLIVGRPLMPETAAGGGSEPTAAEQALAAAATSWLEAYLLDSPREMGLGLLRELLHGTAR